MYKQIKDGWTAEEKFLTLFAVRVGSKMNPLKTKALNLQKEAIEFDDDPHLWSTKSYVLGPKTSIKCPQNVVTLS